MRFGIALLFLFNGAFAQTMQPNHAVQLQQYASQNLQEKIFIHTDKNFWIAGETSWFKVYLVSGQSHQPIPSSRVAYLEVVSSNNEVILQTKVELNKGFGKGQINIPISTSSGNYYLRAYTRWMKNYSPEFYFHQPVTIVNALRRLFDEAPSSNSSIDIQFFPEGGQWIDGIRHQMAFRAIDQNGKGIDFKGAILNAGGDTVVRFQPEKFGIGTFEMVPSATENYRAVIQHNNKIIRTELPPIVSSGFAMQTTDSSGILNISIRTKAVPDQSLYVIAHTRHQVKITATSQHHNGFSNFQLSKAALDAGVSHITVFDATGRPVCERLVFIKPDSTSLFVSPDRTQTSTRKKILLNIQSPKNTVANLSVSVVLHDSLSQFSQPDIVSYLLLSSDLKGTIESSQFYQNANQHLIDNLMLTHGWRRFRWQDLATPTPVKHLPEYRAHLIEADVVDKQTHLPLPGVVGYISTPGKNVMWGGGISDKNGLLLVEANHLNGASKLILQSPSKQAHIEVKPPFSTDFIKISLPAIRLSEKNSKELIARSISMQVNDAFEKNTPPVLLPDSSTFYGTAPETYRLDDYTRFPVMEEVMREYVKSVWVRKKGDQFIFKIVDRTKGQLLENESLVLLDGVPVFNLNDIMAFDPLQIKQLDVLTSRYFVGSLAYDGIVSYRTYKGDLGGFKFNPETLMMDYEGLQQYKEFYSPRYETVPEINSRIPDARHVLYWNPDVQLNGKENKQLEFYTSDQPGTYRVIAQGIATDGTPLFGETLFTVVR